MSYCPLFTCSDKFRCRSCTKKRESNLNCLAIPSQGRRKWMKTHKSYKEAGDGAREKEHCVPAGANIGAKKTCEHWLQLTHMHTHTCTPRATDGDKTPLKIRLQSAGSYMKALRCQPIFPHTNTHMFALTVAHRDQSVGFNWVLSVYHWVDSSKQLKTQTVPSTLLRSAWFSDSHTWGALVIYNLNSGGVLVLLTNIAAEHLFYRTLFEGSLFSYIPATPE